MYKVTVQITCNGLETDWHTVLDTEHENEAIAKFTELTGVALEPLEEEG